MSRSPDLAQSLQAQGFARPVIDLTLPENQPETLRGALGAGIWTTADYAQKNADAVERFTKAMVEASEWLRDPANEEALRASLGKLLGNLVPTEDLGRSAEITRTLVVPAVSEKALASYIEFLGTKANAADLILPSAPKAG